MIQFEFQISYYTNPGKVRGNNEDALLVGVPLSQSAMHAPENLTVTGVQSFILGVADGIGGGNAGEVASRMVVEGMASLGFASTETIDRQLQDLNRSIYSQAMVDSKLTGMGSTIAGMAFADGASWIFHVGDCRVYRVKDGFFQQLTEDDTTAQMLLKAGKLDLDSIRAVNQHAILQALGGRMEYTEIKPHVNDFALNSGGRFMVCSDGVTDFLTLDELENAVLPNLPVAECAKNIVELSSTKELKDNISFIIFDVKLINNNE